MVRDQIRTKSNGGRTYNKENKGGGFLEEESRDGCERGFQGSWAWTVVGEGHNEVYAM